MAKQFLDEAGVTTLWTKCKDTFALNGESGSFAFYSPNSKIKIRTQRCKFHVDGNNLTFDANLVLDNVTESAVSTYNLGYATAHVLPANVREKLIDFNGNPYAISNSDWGYVSYGSSKDVIILHDGGSFGALPLSKDLLFGLCRESNGDDAALYILCPPGYSFPANSTLTLQARLVVSLYDN